MTNQDKIQEEIQEEIQVNQQPVKTLPFYKQNYFLIGSGIGILVATSVLCYSKYKN